MANFYGRQTVIANVPAGTTDYELVDHQYLPDGNGAVITVTHGFIVAADTATDVTLGTKPASGSSGSSSGSDGATIPITPTLPAGMNGGICLPFTGTGWFNTGAGDKLVITTGAGSTVAVLLNYTVAKP